ncbi:hypothetical protein N7522_003591 [Penicillium canescens]|uniref:uncharacterized protein n=1 Tax=Penicillium canescens TaxID=5083 RepID=UPI0026E04557|nr:uncharacterized protein N7446_003484 [Penicillium canescens]KAJ6008575.1 hypothetical protein N7522_003591 [Penicillium canescens]KAJ6066447.1 hypothetical protein N7446_003484 [Penicillium canescens]
MRLRHKRISLDVPVGHGGPRPAPLEDGKGPSYAIQVQPSITFTYGLLAVGVDAGDFSNLGYAGGLAPL